MYWGYLEIFLLIFGIIALVMNAVSILIFFAFAKGYVESRQPLIYAILTFALMYTSTVLLLVFLLSGYSQPISYGLALIIVGVITYLFYCELTGSGATVLSGLKKPTSEESLAEMIIVFIIIAFLMSLFGWVAILVYTWRVRPGATSTMRSAMKAAPQETSWEEKGD